MELELELGAAPAERYTARQRKQLIQRTQELGPTEHEEIFKILSTSGIGHTRNKNGVFINLSSVPDEVLCLVHKFVDFCIGNKHDLDEYDKRLNECKLNQNYQAFLRVHNVDDESATAAPCDGFAEAPGLPSNAGCHVMDALYTSTPSAPNPPAPQCAAAPSAPSVDPAPQELPSSMNPADPAAGLLPKVCVAEIAAMRKQSYSRFIQAKKRYAKKRVVATPAGTLASGAPGCAAAGEVDVFSNELTPEPYEAFATPALGPS